MKKLLVTFVILFAAVALGFLIHENTGYVMVVYRNWAITTNFWVAILTLLVFFLVLYTLIRIFKNTAALPKKIQKKARLSHLQRKQRYLMESISNYISGEYNLAEKMSLRTISSKTPSYISYLMAAFSANMSGDIKKREKYLIKAHQKAYENKLVIKIAKADMLIHSKQYFDAIDILKPLLDEYRKNKKLIQLLSISYQKLNKWCEWLSLLPLLKKHNIYNETELTNLESSAYHYLLNEAFEKKDSQQFQKTWEAIPTELKLLTSISKTYLLFCQNSQPHATCQNYIEQLLKKNWDPTILYFYAGQKNHDKSALLAQLQTAEHWLKKHPNDPMLFAVLANLSYKTQFFTKAQQYADKAFEKAIDDKTYSLVASVYNQLGNKDKSILCYQKAITLIKT